MGEAITVTKPTLGRKVYFVPGNSDTEILASAFNGRCDATVVEVFGSGEAVNLVINDANGTRHTRSSVPFIQDGQDVPVDIGYAHWMPYQINQAKQNAAVEPELKDSGVDQVAEDEQQEEGVTA